MRPRTRFGTGLKVRKMPTVKFDTSRLTVSVLDDLERGIRELPEATPKNFNALYDISLRSFTSGGDLHFLSSALMAMNIEGMTLERAAQISRHLWFRAIEMMDRERQSKLGITKARWIYSNAPCMVDPTDPTPADLKRDSAHRASNGKLYLVAEGLRVDGKLTWPGREPGCRCSSRSVNSELEE
jgi:hypothetical protein